MHIECIIFDFDGTIANTEEHAFRIYNALAKKYSWNTISKEELPQMKQLNLMEIIKLVDIPYHKIPKLIKEGQKLLKQDMVNIQPFEDNLKEIMEEVNTKVHIMGIITSNTKKNVIQFLLNNKIEVFDFIISSPLLTKEKKINSISKKYNLNKEEILYVGDETRDIHACKKAHVKCAAVTWGYNSIEALKREDPDYIIDDIQQLLKLV